MKDASLSGEEVLVVEMLARAVKDLTSKSSCTRNAAQQFFFGTTEPYFREWCDLIDVDPDRFKSLLRER